MDLISILLWKYFSIIVMMIIAVMVVVVGFFFFETESHLFAQAGFKLLVTLLPQPPVF